MLIAKNKKALFNFEIVEKFIAGIELLGYEVKAVKEKNVSFEGSYIVVRDGDIYVVNLNIGKFSKQSQPVDPEMQKRPRRLLLEGREIEKITRHLGEKGKTAVPLALLLNHGLIKLEIATVKGRKEFEKKVVAKEKQIKKELEHENRHYKGH